jgi:UMP-CMP kinase
LGDKVEFKALLFFDCSEVPFHSYLKETMLARILKRSEQSNRSDDNVESIKKRFATYQAETKPIIDHFATLKQVIIVNAEGAEEEVRDSLFAKLKSN